MRDFNTVKKELTEHLMLSGEGADGTRWYYEGTIDLLWEFLELIYNRKFREDK